MKEGGWDNALAVIVTLQAVLPAFLSNAKFSAEKIAPLKERVRYIIIVWIIILVCVKKNV